MFYVYILKSLKDNKCYVGLTCNTEKRLIYHNSGSVRSTKNRRPFIMIHREVYKSRAEAREREKYLKSYRGSGEKKELINKYWGIV